MQTARGVSKFKCATIAEVEMAANCEVKDILLAYQPVGPNIDRLVILTQRFPNTRFSTVADDAEIIRNLSKTFASEKAPLEVLLDIDSGMNRTGIAPCSVAAELYRLISDSPGLIPGGLHAYDGHLKTTDLAERTTACDEAYRPVAAFRDELLEAGLPVPRMVVGGTPTFPIHARRTGVECSPGTTLFWDSGYASKLPDLDFLPAALVLTRVISKPGANRLCLDLGHKAIAAENPHPRVELLNIPDATSVLQSEEHLVIETSRAPEFAVGDCVYGIPLHICPTVALHSTAWIVKDGALSGQWKIVARERTITL